METYVIGVVDQILVSETWGYVLPAIVGVWLAFSGKYIKKILANFATWIRLKRLSRHQDHNSMHSAESTPLNPSTVRSRGEHSEDSLVRIYKESGGTVRDLVTAAWSNEYGLAAGTRLCLVLFILVVAFASIGMIVVGVLTSKVKINAAARLASKHCGLWLFDQRAGNEAATRAGIHDLEKETRAGEYAQNCYGTPNTFDSIRCDFFYRRNISFRTDYSYDCPFQSDIICARGQPSVTFETDLVDAGDVGINSPRTNKFSRRTRCAPLNMDYPYIKNTTHNGTTTYYYHYSEKIRKEFRPPQLVEYTHNTSGDPFADGLAPVYEV